MSARCRGEEFRERLAPGHLPRRPAVGPLGVQPAPSSPESPDREPAWPARLAGLVAAGVALGIGELVSATGGHGQSLVGSVGGEVIDQLRRAWPATGIDAVRHLGQGRCCSPPSWWSASCSAPSWASWPGRRPWVGPGGLRRSSRRSGWSPGSATRSPTAPSPWSPPCWPRSRGAVTLELLLLHPPAPAAAARGRRRRPPAPLARPGPGAADRRAFLAWSGHRRRRRRRVGAVGGRALVRAGPRSRPAGRRSCSPAPTATLPGAPAGTVARRAGSTCRGSRRSSRPTPTSTGSTPPSSSPGSTSARWQLRVEGEVDTPSPSPSTSCWPCPRSRPPSPSPASPTRSAATSSATPSGRACPSPTCSTGPASGPTGTQIVGRSVDGFTVGFPTAAATDGRIAMVAVGMNGEPLPLDHGFPARLIVEGLYGYVSATKWLSSDPAHGLGPFDAYWVTPRLGEGGPDQDPVPHRRAPRRGDRSTRATVAVAGRGLGTGPGHPARSRCRSTTADWAPGRARPGPLGRHLAPVGAARGTPRPATTPSGSGPPTAPARSRPATCPGPSPTAPPAGTPGR